MNRESEKSKVLSVLARHVGRHRAIGMDRLFEAVYGEDAGHKINGTRKLRRLVTALRREGVPIASISDSDGGGYYLTGAGSELTEYLGRLHRRGIKALDQEAKIRGISLGELLGQVQINLRGEADAGC